MQPWPDTRDTLLTRLRNPADQQAWAEFAQLYGPLIFRFAVGRGLQEADARDITQRVLWTVARAAERWEPGTERGRFRGWLAKVTTNAVLNLVQRDAKHRGSGRTSVWDLLEQTPQGDEDAANRWRHEKRCQMFRWAANRVRSRFTDDVWSLFWRTAVDGEAIENVAAELGKTLGAAYAARSRVLVAIRRVVNDIELSESVE
jgi:RNA polymerase sigma-70 factor (ECF subfamily)